MKKHLVAFLSMIGLAGAAAPVQAQILKTSGQESKAESQIKQDKHKQEKNAVQKIREYKSTKGASAGNAAKSEVSVTKTTDAAKKNKADDWTTTGRVEQKSVQSNLQKKNAKRKSKPGVKYESRDQSKSK